MTKDSRKILIDSFFAGNNEGLPKVVHPSIVEAREILKEQAKKARCPICDGRIWSVSEDRILFECGHYLGKW